MAFVLYSCLHEMGIFGGNFTLEAAEALTLRICSALGQF
jgi:hypothetical protein